MQMRSDTLYTLYTLNNKAPMSYYRTSFNSTAGCHEMNPRVFYCVLNATLSQIFFFVNILWTSWMLKSKVTSLWSHTELHLPPKHSLHQRWSQLGWNFRLLPSHTVSSLLPSLQTRRRQASVEAPPDEKILQTDKMDGKLLWCLTTMILGN